jgi:uncharacterized protein YcfJ
MIAAIPIGVSVLSGCTTVPSSPAAPGYVDTAEVVQAEPLYQTVQVARPVSECWTEERLTHDHHDHGGYLGPVAGGIIGGVIGNELGRGRGKAPLAVAGALIGASLGHRASASSHGPPRRVPVRHCETVHRFEERQHIVGYRVDYRYEGQIFTTRTRRHPGRFIRVRVNVDPATGT